MNTKSKTQNPDKSLKFETHLGLEEKHYKPGVVEDSIYARWKTENVFSCNPSSSKIPFSIVIPPPNITGRLHMGHALNDSVQDCLCRFKRMDGYDVLWLPGTDHAGISTQSVVKKHLDAEGINFRELGREKVIERIWEWRNKYGNQILLQLEKLGASCDWSRLRFTMDEGLSKAVRVAFKKLYDEGLIYKGKYIVNWCPIDRTALSDDEVYTKDGGEPGALWHIKYPLSNGSGFLTIATTRPETMLGDTAIAVNPKDERYKKLIGNSVKLPLSERTIPIIGDEYVDSNFGTGCLKVTPAHDPNDFQIGLRHKLPQINVMNEDATIGDEAPLKYHGLDRFECRKQIIEELTALSLLEKTEERMTPVSRAERSKAIIEYRLSDQWFVKMKPLAEKALDASNKGEIKLYPERWDSVYRNWLENTRDWCISRQIWWGHQIPAWTNKDTGEIRVEVDTPEEVLKEPLKWERDPDVLDTWFSSALWPYSTMGWPDTESKDLKKYYPTSVLTTAKDIIYFWVARMVMTGTHFMSQVPFREVYFHPVICDANGETMSKSKGNGIDPLHVIEGASTEELEGPVMDARPSNMNDILMEIRKNYPEGFQGVGADALRITLFSLNSQAQQAQLSLAKFDEIGKRFVDKLWNASRFVLGKLNEGPISNLKMIESEYSIEDRWILGRLDQTTEKVRKSIDTYKFHEAVNALMVFFWDDFCDWYLEISKDSLKNPELEKAAIKRSILTEVFAGTLKLLHPFTPFITEELWSHLGKSLNRAEKLDNIKVFDSEILALSAFPKDQGRFQRTNDDLFNSARTVVRNLRNIRSELGIASHSPVPVCWKSLSAIAKSKFSSMQNIIQSEAHLSSITEVEAKPSGFLSVIMEDLELYVDISRLVDVKAEIIRNKKQIEKINKEINSLDNRLNNPNFLAKAPAEVRDQNIAERSALDSKRDKILRIIGELSSQ
ncbi:MAG TPA: valine--tRNA ligase [Oligoflexia bacterium]|nr:valine--tRNA ligase [Oligoflexia bacterium]HMP47630.1 valine--tRNA ligase [Oligoflexia bacterium]